MRLSEYLCLFVRPLSAGLLRKSGVMSAAKRMKTKEGPEDELDVPVETAAVCPMCIQMVRAPRYAKHTLLVLASYAKYIIIGGPGRSL